MPARDSVRRDFEQAVEIFALKTHDTYGIDVAELALAHGQGCAGDFDRVIESWLTAAQRFEPPARFLPAPTSQSRHGYWPGDPIHDFIRMPPQEPLVRPRQAILGEVTDHFKQSGADVVVEGL